MNIRNHALLLMFGMVVAFVSVKADDLMPQGDEFENPASISQWHRLNDVEGWNADQLEAWDVDTTVAGAMHVMPHTSSWFMDLRGVLVFKEITGDFVTTMRLNVLSRHNAGDPTEPPNRSFSLAGIFAHAPRGITSAAPTPYTTNSVWPPGDFGSDWQPDTDNYIFLSMGSAGNPGTRQCEVKTTLNGNSQLYYHSSGVSNSTEVTLQMVRIGNTAVVLRRHPGGSWIVENRYPNADHAFPNFGNTLQVGITTYTDWENIGGPYYDNGNHVTQFHHNYLVLSNQQPDLVANVDYVRFQRPDTNLTEALLQALPTSYDPVSNTSTATNLPASGAGQYLGDNANAPLGLVAIASTQYDVNEVDGNASIEVTRSGSSTNHALTLHVTLGGGTATAGDDYTDVSGMLSWSTNDTAAKTIDIPIVNDCEIEGEETLQLSLTSLSGPATFTASVTSVMATLTIHDPPMPTLTIDNAGTSMTTISWTPDVPGLVLQNAISLSTGNWVNSSSGSTNPAMISIAAPAQFFRLICQ